MGRRERRYGSVPPHRRRLFAVATAVVAAAVIVGGLLLSAFAGTPVRWGGLIIAAGAAVGMYSIYLWIRLSD